RHTEGIAARDSRPFQTFIWRQGGSSQPPLMLFARAACRGQARRRSTRSISGPRDIDSLKPLPNWMVPGENIGCLSQYNPRTFPLWPSLTADGKKAKGVPKMDREHVKGTADKAKGTIKDTAGKLTGDKKL